MVFFGEDFYYSNYYGSTDTSPEAPSSGLIDIPIDLKFYRTNVDGVYVFHWGFNENFISPSLAALDYTLEIDTVNTFDSSAKTSFTSSTAISYQNGNIRKGFAVPVASRVDNVTQTWYAHVRSFSGSDVSGWSDPIAFTVLPRVEMISAERLLNYLPDGHVYNKEDLRKAVSLRNTNIYTIDTVYGKEFDSVFLERTLTAHNNYISLCRDEYLFDNYGVLFNYAKPQNQQFIEYRNTLESLITSSLVGGTETAIRKVIKSFTGVNPDIQLIRNNSDFFINSVMEVPAETPDGTRTFFSTSSDYIPGTLVVLKDGTVQTPGVDFTENHSTPGFTMASAPSASGPTSTVTISYTPTSLPQNANPLWSRGNNTSIVTESVSSNILHLSVAGTASQNLVYFRSTVSNIGDEFIFDGRLDSPSGTHTSSNTLLLSIHSTVLQRAWGVRLCTDGIYTNVNDALYSMDCRDAHVYKLVIKNDATVDVYVDDVLRMNIPGFVGNFGDNFAVYVTGTCAAEINGWSYTTQVPTASSLQTVFEIGKLGDPEAVVLDLTNNTAITGTTATNGSKTVTGSSTTFTTTFQVGNWITDSAGAYLGEIASIETNTSLTLRNTWIGPTGAIRKVLYNGSMHLSGTNTFTSSDTVVTGVGSQYLTEVQAGDTITDNNMVNTGVVQAVLSDTQLILTSNWAGSTGSNVNARKLIYSSPVTWDRTSLAHGILIRVLNPGHFTLNEEVIKALVLTLVPAHVLVYFEFL